MKSLTIEGAGVAVHNLKEITFSLPKKKFIVITGVSGSGKTSLAFDTLHAEGQRRYLYTLPPFVRSKLPIFLKPKATRLEGITPSIAVDQKSLSSNTGSMVAARGGIYDLMRILMEKCATPRCPVSLEPLFPLTLSQLLEKVNSWACDRRIWIVANGSLLGQGDYVEALLHLEKRGILRVRIGQAILTIKEAIKQQNGITENIGIVIDRLDMKNTSNERCLESLKHALEYSDGILTLIDYDTGEEKIFSEKGYSQQSNRFYPPLTWSDFSYTQVGSMCPGCEGRGEIEEFDLSKLIDKSKSINEGVSPLVGSSESIKWGNIYRNLATKYQFSLDTPWSALSKEAQTVLLEGVDGWISMEFIHPKKNKRWKEYIKWKGFFHEIKKKYAAAKSARLKQEIEATFKKHTCPHCKGSRIKPYPSAALLHDKTWLELCAMTLEQAKQFMDDQQWSSIAQPLVDQITKRLHFCISLGLGYITLNRPTHTLSGGEAQRLRLSKALGSSLQEITYILDEPSIGLHPHDHQKLLNALHQLKAQNNTVIVVEHDIETIISADHVVDLGPGGGAEGGALVASGSIKDLMQCPNSKIGQYLNKKWSLPAFTKKQHAKEWIHLQGATLHNVIEQEISIPLERLTVVSGVSGSGKSTLIQEVLYTALTTDSHRCFHSINGHQSLDRIVALGQTPLGRSSRSTLATYTGVWDEIRELYAMLPESRMRGYTISRFSFNSEEGICTRCKGLGCIEVDAEHPLEECPDCLGKRYNEHTLSVHYKSTSIHDVLNMTVTEARIFFSAFPKIHKKLDMLHDIGVGYLTLGQPSSTLSGGEAQRIKLARSLLTPSNGNTLYLLDEPSVGLHIHDIGRLLTLLHKLTDQGHTVVVIEHDMEIVIRADYLIDLGPGAGDNGGNVIYQGAPTQYTQKTPTANALQALQKPRTLSPKAVKTESPPSAIIMKQCREHNLNAISTSFAHNAITLVRGHSGSGKTSLIMHTLYAHAIQEYRDSLPQSIQPYLPPMPSPIVDEIQGVSPPIAIDRHTHHFSRRSTCATLSELYEPFTKLYARYGIAHCPDTKEPLTSVTPSTIADQLLDQYQNAKTHILAPLAIQSEAHFYETLKNLQQKGYLRLRIGKEYYTFEDTLTYSSEAKEHTALVVDRVIIKDKTRSRLLSAIEEATSFSSSNVWVDCDSTLLKFNLSFSCLSTGKSYPSLEPKLFMFNHTKGECPECRGLGSLYSESILDNAELQKKTVMGVFNHFTEGKISANAKRYFLDALKEKGISFFSTVRSLSEEEQLFLCKGHGHFKGLAQWQPHTLLASTTCPSCAGGRLNRYASAVTYKGHTLPNLMRLTTQELLNTLSSHAPHITKKLQWLIALGLSDISLGQSSSTLSESEVQRITLAGHIQVNLTNALYLLDTPTSGLSATEVSLIKTALQNLREQANTVIVIDNNPELIGLADHILELDHGNITYDGSPQNYPYTPPTIPSYTPKPHKKSIVMGPTEIPLHSLVLMQERHPAKKRALINQLTHTATEHTDINKVVVHNLHSSFTARSDIATYLDILTPLRYFFSTLPESKIRGLMPKHFSYNHRSGLCKQCRGLGVITHYFHYIPPTKVPCKACHGYRLNPQALSILYQGNHLGKLLQSTPHHNLLPPLPKYQGTLELLQNTNLDHLPFSTPLKNLSQGEWHKLALVKTLISANKSKTLILLDEPFAGLSLEETLPLFPILHQQCKLKNSILLWENRQELNLLSDFELRGV